jgi:hypothetical protein
MQKLISADKSEEKDPAESMNMYVHPVRSSAEPLCPRPTHTRPQPPSHLLKPRCCASKASRSGGAVSLAAVYEHTLQQQVTTPTLPSRAAAQHCRGLRDVSTEATPRSAAPPARYVALRRRLNRSSAGDRQGFTPRPRRVRRPGARRPAARDKGLPARSRIRGSEGYSKPTIGRFGFFI